MHYNIEERGEATECITAWGGGTKGGRVTLVPRINKRADIAMLSVLSHVVWYPSPGCPDAVAICGECIVWM